jgi:hypothetical protein
VSFLSDFCSNKNKNKPAKPQLSSLFNILKEPILVQKQTTPHIKASILSFFEPETRGSGIIMEASPPTSVNFLITFLSEVLEAK